MELSKIEALLEKYWAAETSIEEEKVLYNYFNSGVVASHLKQYGMLFEYYKEDKSKTLNKDLKIPIKQQNKNYLKYAITAAAIVLVALFLGKREYEHYKQRKQFAQVKEALYLLSLNLNKGNDAIYEVSNSLLRGSDAVAHLDTYEITANKVIEKINN